MPLIKRFKSITYAPFSRAKCRKSDCKIIKIEKNELRMAHKKVDEDKPQWVVSKNVEKNMILYAIVEEIDAILSFIISYGPPEQLKNDYLMRMTFWVEITRGQKRSKS